MEVPWVNQLITAGTLLTVLRLAVELVFHTLYIWLTSLCWCPDQIQRSGHFFRQEFVLWLCRIVSFQCKIDLTRGSIHIALDWWPQACCAEKTVIDVKNVWLLMNGKSLDNPKRLVFRLNDLEIYIYIFKTHLSSCLFVMALIWHSYFTW